MPRLSLNLNDLRVESFATATWAEVQRPISDETYPDCPTATGCTCIESCFPENCPPPDTWEYPAETWPDCPTATGCTCVASCPTGVCCW